MCHTRVMRNVWMPLLLLVCAACFAQQPGTPDPAKTDQDLRIVTGVNVVIAPTTVLDKHGDYVNGLQLEDFELFDNNKRQIIKADVHDQPLSLLIAVQKSSNLTEILPKVQRIGSMLSGLIAG